MVFQPKLFYQNYQEPKGSFTHSLWDRGIQKALTLHPVKQPTYMYRLHQYQLTLKTASLRGRLRRLQREIDAMNGLLESRDRTKRPNQFTEMTAKLNRLIQRTDDEVPDWDCVRTNLYSTRSELPRMFLPSDASSVMSDIKEEVQQIVFYSAFFM